MTTATVTTGNRQRTGARIGALCTANPAHVLHQSEVAERAGELFGGRLSSFNRLKPVYENAAIETRYSCVPINWYQEQHGFSERNRLFIENAVDLLCEAAEDAARQSGISLQELDGIVAVSTSGIATPSLDALVMERLNLPRTMQRLPVFGLGCAGGVIGLSRAAQMAMSQPGKKFLYLCVELCGLTFRSRDFSKSNVVATALFGDGAAAAIIGTDLDGPMVEAFGEHTWADTLDIMGWDVTDDGLSVIFSRDIPTHVHKNMRQAAETFLSDNGLSLADIDQIVSHPGGAKVLDALEQVFELPENSLQHSRNVLRDYGNMSAVTVLFVLRAAMDEGLKGRTLMTTLGPGFTSGFLTLTSS